MPRAGDDEVMGPSDTAPEASICPYCKNHHDLLYSPIRIIFWCPYTDYKEYVRPDNRTLGLHG